jgi:hypothetical protein
VRERKRKGSGLSRANAIDGVRWEEIECDALELYLGISRLMSHFHESHRPIAPPATRPRKKRP